MIDRGVLAQAAAAEYPGVNGFLGTRATVMLDVVFVAMFLVLPVMCWSIWLVKYRRRYRLHKQVQIALFSVLAVAVGAFELDMQFVSGWRERAVPSPFYEDWVFYSLYIHLCFAVPTLVLWIYVLVAALRRFSNPPLPGEHSRAHILWGQIAAYGMGLTAITGWIFYYLSFVVT